MTLPDVRVRLPARAENLAIIREVMRGVADPLALDALLIDDIQSVVSEAATNVIAHAYPGAEAGGPMQLDVHVRGELEISLLDWGVGMGLGPDLEGPHGIGMPLMQACSPRFSVQGAPGEGVEVRAAWPLHQSRAGDARPEWDDVALPGETVLTARPGMFLGGVVGRVVAALCVHAGLSVDRLADAQMLTDALTDNSPSLLLGSHLSIRINPLRRRLELAAGPLVAGGAQALVQACALGPVPFLERLASEVGSHQLGRDAGELLVLTLLPAR